MKKVTATIVTDTTTIVSNQHRNSFITALLLYVLCLGLSSCGSTPTQAPPTTIETATDRLNSQEIPAYLEEAEKLPAEQKIDRQLFAIKSLIKLNDPAWAKTILSLIETQSLNQAQFTEFLLYQAQIALHEGEPYLAKRYLFHPLLDERLADSKLEIVQELLDLRATLLFEQSEYLQSFEQRIRLNPFISEQPEIHQLNNDLIWEALAELSSDRLFHLAKTEKKLDKQGWYSLAAMSKNNGANFRKQIKEIRDWQQLWPEHSANQFLPADLQLILQLADEQARQLAILLPLSGKLASAGQAIRDGLLAAYYEEEASAEFRPLLRIYDTEGQEVNALYDRAVAEGAELVIGPLSKSKVNALAARESLITPVLVLNNTEVLDKPVFEPAALEPTIPATPVLEELASTGHPELFELSLAVEGEARQTAIKAWRDGQRRALIIGPSNNWGDRAINAFREQWINLGGEVIDEQRYRDQRSYSPLIESAVAVDLSKKRKQALERMIGESLKFEPRRRKDIDFVFLLAYSLQGQQIKPLLAFHYAGDVPVYSTSQIYDGKTQGLNDLNGVRFPTLPWFFDERLPERRAIHAYVGDKAAYETLYALGVDAYHIYPRLKQLKKIREAHFYGATGRLKMNSDNRLEREQTWVQIINGKAVLQKSLNAPKQG